ncbi:MAG TPA: hypothetical protein DGG94_22925 [Micromonosporaceae bacterium]|nr:hypothetical protein [Micromonosporaceae bacterium]HCU52605.1 hypothetical protein [Micromonosporaceae bacterium]
MLLALLWEPTPTPSPSPTPTPAQPVVEVKIVTETVTIPFERIVREDPSMAEGTRVTSVKGKTGKKTTVFEIALTDGKQTGKRLIFEAVTSAPVAEQVVIGTGRSTGCDPNYAGACVPIAFDVDCLGGRGNGPAYVQGPVVVIGWDIYGLDGDDDGIGCE